MENKVDYYRINIVGLCAHRFITSSRHYFQAFSKDGDSFTMSAKNASHDVFVDTDYRLFGFYDNLIINSLYNCAGRTIEFKVELS
jgi:hypothetical protein